MPFLRRVLLTEHGCLANGAFAGIRAYFTHLDFHFIKAIRTPHGLFLYDLICQCLNLLFSLPIRQEENQINCAWGWEIPRVKSIFLRMLLGGYIIEALVTGLNLSFNYSDSVYILEENLFVSYLDILVYLTDFGDVSFNTYIVSFTIEADSYLATLANS